jgi:formiminoglutamase
MSALTSDHASSSAWHGRVDSLEGEGGRRWHQIVKPASAELANGAIALLGFACDRGVARNGGRTGAAEGPAAIRDVLCNLPVHRLTAVADAGDVICVGDELEAAQAQLAERVASLLDAGHFPMVLGGGHEMAYGSYRGLEQHLAAKQRSLAAFPRIGIINLDAHFDLRQGERGNSGTPFRQIAECCTERDLPFNYCCMGVSRFSNTQSLFERATQLGVSWRLDDEMGVAMLDECRAMLTHFVASVDVVYLTICLDVLPAATAPGVSAPAARGVSLEVIEPLIDLITASGKLRLADIAEMNPRFDIDQRTARVAARLVARIAEATSTR